MPWATAEIGAQPACCSRSRHLGVTGTLRPQPEGKGCKPTQLLGEGPGPRTLPPPHGMPPVRRPWAQSFAALILLRFLADLNTAGADTTATTTAPATTTLPATTTAPATTTVPATTTAPATTPAPSECAFGFYPHATSYECLACPAGKFSWWNTTRANYTAATACTDCPPGYVSGAQNSTRCSMCESGKYSPLASQTLCLQCSSYAVSPAMSMLPGQARCICLQGYERRNLVHSCGPLNATTCGDPSEGVCCGQ